MLASALLVTAALGAGLWPERAWLVGLTICLAVTQGVLAGLMAPRYWRGSLSEEILEAGGRYAGFVLAVLFSAVEAYAVGRGLDRGAPRGALALLVPPVLLAGLALRSAEGIRRRRAAETGGAGDDGVGESRRKREDARTDRRRRKT